MRTHYIGHDAVYRRKRAAGLPGWGTAADAAENIVGLAEALRAPDAPQCGRVLELGCGAGDISLWLVERGYEVWGVDVAPTAVAWAREKAEAQGLTAHFAVGDVRDLRDYADGFFDFALDGSCLHCIIGADRPLFLSSVLRVLRPGGFFHVNTMCNGPVSEGLRQGFDPVSRCQLYGDIATRYLGFPEQIAAEVEAVGFILRRWRVIAHADEEGEDILRLDAVKPD